MKFTDAELGFLPNICNAAADMYSQDANSMAVRQQSQLAEQFRRQAKEARDLAERIQAERG